ncbi:unnamed protein product [Zymoseptoria tritici ST99CH_1A5]|uniref:Uncharacterized protein n=1 Tax=Zymoseptoria tritici ST99CH_1A5 TaxID=1276529 RepID=A0A1Y6LTY5_ZYMTR|nr:unnamed protein product [Zymoseptoria tritici ST99CH_1A5]
MNPSGLLFRRTAPRVQTPLRQKRWAQVSDVRFYAIKPDPTERYREALERKAREKGLKDTNELREAYADRIKRLRKESMVPGLNTAIEEEGSSTPSNPQPHRPPPQPRDAASSIPYQPPPPPQPQATPSSKPQSSSTKPSSAPPVRTLSSFIDVEKSSSLPQKELETIWRLRHVRDPQSLAAVLPSSTYNRIATTAKQHPQFVLPIPHPDRGAEIHFLQWTFPSPTTATVLFTHLAEFKLRGEFAQPHTTVTYHVDFAEEKGLVLMEGRVQEGKGVSVEEGRFLVMGLQKFYGWEGKGEGKRRRLMEQFSGGDEGFRVEELLEETEKVP